MSFSERLKAAREEKGYTQSKLGGLIGYGNTTINGYESGANKPNLDIFVQICKIFDRDPNYFLQDDITDIVPKLNPEDQYIIDRYKSLTPHDKEIVDHIFKMEPEKPMIIYRFPVYEQQAAAGAGITGRDGKFTMQNIMANDIPKNAVFGVHIKGTSMINTDPTFIIEDIPDNSFVLLNPRVSVSDLNKTIVVASINNEVICKYFLEEQDCVHFYSLNREEHADDDRFAKSPNDYKIIGQVVKVIKPNEHE